MKAHELIADETKWTKGFYALDSMGQRVLAGHKDACCWCMVGAIIKCYPDQGVQNAKLMDVKEYIYGDEYTSRKVHRWNDHDDRKHEDVVYVLKRLDI